jgi:hypothetical protein
MRKEMIFTILVILVVAGAGVSYFFWTNQRAASNSLVTTYPPTANWTVVRTGLTVYYYQACMVIESSTLSCPTMDTVSRSPYLNNVDLIKYEGNYYYTINFTYTHNGQPITRDVWFTNSTIFCISPSPQSNYQACPTQLTCDVAPKGSTLYIKITLDDGKTPVTNATVEAIPVETCSGVDTSLAIVYHPVVNSTGVATEDSSYLTYYAVTIHYDGRSYPFVVHVQNSRETCARLRVPFGNTSVTSC